MNTRKLLLGLGFIALISNTYAQLSEFDLSNFKLPDLERRYLVTNLSLSGYNYFENIPDDSNTSGNDLVYNSLNSNINLDYTHTINTVKLQRNSEYIINFSSQFQNNIEDNKLQYESKAMNPNLYYNIDNRKYFKQNLFFETDLTINYQYGHNYYFFKRSNSDISKQIVQRHSVYALMPLKFGKGRIEEVQDARHAIYIFQELANVNSMSPDKTDEQIIEFATLISQLKNKRYFDSRLQKIAEIESIDSFFVANNYVKKSDAKYFTTLNDFWVNGNNHIRQSGTRLSAVVLPGYYLYNEKRISETEDYNDTSRYNVSSVLLNGGIEFNYEKPINLFWQNSINLTCNAGLIQGALYKHVTLVETDVIIPNLQLGFNQTIGFYPNTRTDFNLSYFVQYVKHFDKTNVQENVLGDDAMGAKAGTSISINYYISPQFRLNLSSSYSYTWQDSDESVNLNFYDKSGIILLSEIHPYTHVNATNYKSKRASTNFRLSLLYSIF